MRKLPEPGETSLRNCIGGRVLEIRPNHRLRHVTVACGSLRMVAVVKQAALDELDVRIDDPIVAGFKASSVHVLPRRHGDPG